MSKLKQPIAIYYEHPHWFVPLFKELERRKVPFVRIDAAQHHFDPAHLNGEGEYSLVFNRMSPSAYRRGHALDKRRKLMAAWANYCEPKTGNVIPMKRSK